ncbi:hypothetical protein BGZ65_009056, partial [Modicella reniformis]
MDYSEGDDDEQDHNLQKQDPSPQKQDPSPQKQDPSPQKQVEEHGTGSSEMKPLVVVNDYGFILGRNGGDSTQIRQVSEARATTVSLIGDMTGRLDPNYLTEHERKRTTRKMQEQSREDELKWVHAMQQQPDQVKKSSKFKKLVRRGVPSSVRGRVWQFLANTNAYRKPGVFQELLTRGHIPIHDVIARDVDRCYPDHVHFRDGMGTGQEDLHSILKAYAHYKPSVGYCQGMGRLVGMMLMQMPVEEAFWLLVATIEGYLNEYFTPTLRQLRIDAQVFEQLLQSQDPRLAQHLNRNDVLPLMYMTQWFLTLFTMSLPWASVLRVWDVFYFDGVRTLYRTGLAVLQLCRQHLLDHCPSSSECMDYLLHIPLEILGPEALLEKTAYRIKLRKEVIERMSAFNAGEMDAKEGSTISLGSASVTTSNVESMQDRMSGKIDEDIEEEDEEVDIERKENHGKAETGSGLLTVTTTSPKITTNTTVITTTTTMTTLSKPSKGIQVAIQTPASSLSRIVTTVPSPTSPNADAGMIAGTTTANITPITPTETIHDYINNHNNSNHIYNARSNEKTTATAAGEGTGRKGSGDGQVLSHAEDEIARINEPEDSALEKELPELPRPRSQPSMSRSFATTTTTVSMSQAGAESLLSSS